ncbi:MAG TPA: NADH-quinone oxidoreductase subunit M, partial [Allosphingosinicella sp.]
MNPLGFPILSEMLVIPLAAAIVCLCVSANTARWVALVATLIELALGILLWSAFDLGGRQWQFRELVNLFGTPAESAARLGDAPFYWALGVDGIAVMLIMLSVFLMPICIAASWSSIEHRIPEYMASFLLMETLMLGVFM